MINDTQPGCVIKFFEKKYVDKFINEGELHFSQLGYFIDLENDGDVIADAFEGSRILNLDAANSDIFVTINGKKINFCEGDTIRIVSIPQWVREKGILSLINLDLIEDFDCIDYDDSRNQYTLKKSVINDLNRLSDNKKRIPVMIDAQKFLQKLDSNFSKYHAEFKIVHYYSDKIEENISLKEFKQKSMETLFLKRDQYAYQREARIAFRDSVPQNGKNVYIGDLTDLTWKLDPESGLESLRLLYPK